MFLHVNIPTLIKFTMDVDGNDGKTSEFDFVPGDLAWGFHGICLALDRYHTLTVAVHSINVKYGEHNLSTKFAGIPASASTM